MIQRCRHPTLSAHLLGILLGFAELADGLVTISSLGFLCSSFGLQVARHRAREILLRKQR